MKRLALTAAVLCANFACEINAQGLSYPSVWQCDTNKPNWYCDKSEEEPPKPLAPIAPPALPPVVAVPPPVVKKPLKLEEIKTIEELREEIKRRLDVATMSGKEEDVKSYMEINQFMMDKSSMFTDQWRRVVWGNPDLDYSQRRPTNNSAVRAYEEGRGVADEGQLKELAKKHGLIYFFRSDCPYCKVMSPSIKAFAKKYGFDILGVSVDGKGVAEFPNAANGMAHAQKWGVERVPALFIGSKETGDKAPIGFGIMSSEEVINRLVAITSTKPGEQF